MKQTFLEFEQPIAELEAKIEELRYVQDDSALDISEEISRLQKKSNTLTKEIYGKLSPWQISQVARHPQRPTLWTTSRAYSPTSRNCMATAPSPTTLRWSAARPLLRSERDGDRPSEGPRHQGKAATATSACRGPRATARRCGSCAWPRSSAFPVLTLRRHAGRLPGRGRGGARAVRSDRRTILYVMAELRVPIVVTIIGEGGSGGALAIAVGDVVMMLQYATYSGDLAGGLRLDPVEERREGARRRGEHWASRPTG